MKFTLPWLPLVMLVIIQPVLAAMPVDPIRNYVQQVYGSKLQISDQQIEQLSWVFDNPVTTPEMATGLATQSIHPEIPRALSRLYSLQLLKSGKNEDYQYFISPQKGGSVLKKDGFMALSKAIASMDQASFETLQVTAIISAVALSETAKIKAAEVLKDVSLPEDANRFLSATALEATQIYPLARQLIRKYPGAQRKLAVIYLPDSHFRHMMYNEGSLGMYGRIKSEIRSGQLTQTDLDLWYAHWVINIAGFRGHLAPEGSLYLDQKTFRAMHQLKGLLDKLLKDTKLNPVTVYLQKRAHWLSLERLVKQPNERLFDAQEGKVLVQSFHRLSAQDQRRWLAYVERQQTSLTMPTPTYAPALLANAMNQVGLAETIQKIVPVLLDSYEMEHKLRQADILQPDVPLSFRELAREAPVTRILKSSKPQVVDINPEDGVVMLKGM